MALFNHASTVNSDREARANQYVVIGPNPRCRFSQLREDYKVGDRGMGDASFPVDEQIWAFFDRCLKDKPAAFASGTPHLRYFTMRANRWQSASQWPPTASQPVSQYLRTRVDATSMARELAGSGKGV